MKINSFPSASDLLYFQDIARSLNLSRSSERLGVAQPTLSLSLKRLEELLGVDLFFRRSRGLTLSPAGHRLVKESNTLLAAWEHVVSETKKSVNELVGTFTIGCHQSVALYALDKVADRLYSEYQGIEIKHVHGLSRVICEGVIGGQINFGIVVNPIRHADLVIHNLGADEFCFWKIPKGRSDVLIYDPALFQSQSMIKKLISKSSARPFARTLASDSLEVVARLAQSGVGVAILPTRVAKIMAPDLRPLESFPKFHDELSFIYRSDLPKTESAKALIKIIKGISLKT